MIAREEVITKSQDPITIMAKLQEMELAQAVEPGKQMSHHGRSYHPVRC